jgi:hypothetical protein
MTNVHLWLSSVIFLTLTSFTWHWTQRKRGWPWSTPLYDPGVRHFDLLLPWTFAASKQPYFHPQHENVTPYLPAYYYITGAIYQPRAVTIYRAVYLGLAYALCLTYGWHLLVVLFGYPVLFANDRGSIDHILGVMVAISVALLLGGHPIYGAIILAAAVALKGFPAPFGLLWLLRGEWIGLAVLAVVTVALVVFPARSFLGGIRETYAGWKRELAAFHRLGVLALKGPMWSTSHYSIDALNAIRLCYWWRDKAFDVAKFLRYYTPVVFTVAAALAWRAATTDQLWVCLMCLGLIPLIVPHVANDYKLAMLVPGIIAWLAIGAPGWTVWACLLLLWVPKSYWFPRPELSAASIACVVSPIAVVGLVIGVLG